MLKLKGKKIFLILCSYSVYVDLNVSLIEDIIFFYMIVSRKGWGVQLNTYQIEAAWKLGNWEKLKTFVKVVSCSHKK